MAILSEAQREVVRLFHETNIPYREIMRLTGLTESQVSCVIYKHTTPADRKRRKIANYRASRLGSLNPMYGKRGKDSPKYKGGISDGKGYLLILKPDWFTGRTGCKHIFYHHLVYCEANGLTEIPKGMVVHHRDGDKHNNSIENLELMTQSQHTTIHQRERATTIRERSREGSESLPTEALHSEGDVSDDDIVCSHVKA